VREGRKQLDQKCGAQESQADFDEPFLDIAFESLMLYKKITPATENGAQIAARLGRQPVAEMLGSG
jgi:hypothetical protein